MLVHPYECYDDAVRAYSQQISSNLNAFNPQTSIQQPFVTFPPGGQSFDFQQAIAIPVVGAGFINVVNFLVPNGLDGVIDRYAANWTGAGFIDGSGDLVWRITANGKAIQNYEAILTERGDPNLPRDISPIRIYSNQNIAFLVNHVANPGLGAGYIICTLSGYWYPNT